MTTKTTIFTALILAALTTVAAAQTTFRDASGRITGTATRDSNGTTTFRTGRVGPLAQLQPTATEQQRSVTARAGLLARRKKAVNVHSRLD
jgi:hypothetical protein